MFKVMLDCRTGTRRLTSDTTSTYWEDLYHVVTFSCEQTAEAAQAIVDAQRLNPQVRNAWVESRQNA